VNGDSKRASRWSRTRTHGGSTPLDLRRSRDGRFLATSAVTAVSEGMSDPTNPPAHGDVRRTSARVYQAGRGGRHPYDDMDINHTEAVVTFPTFPRFCGARIVPEPPSKTTTSRVVAWQAYKPTGNDRRHWCAEGGLRSGSSRWTLIRSGTGTSAGRPEGSDGAAAKGVAKRSRSQNPVESRGSPASHRVKWIRCGSQQEPTRSVNMHARVVVHDLLTPARESPPSVAATAATFSGACSGDRLDHVGTLARFPDIRSR